MARVEVPVVSGSLLQFYQIMWGPIYESVLNILGSTGTILPIGDPKHGQPNATAFTTVGEEQVTFTWSEAPNSFDTKLDLTSADSFQGIIPIVEFNGTDEEADTPDAAYWSRDDSAGQGFSVGVWCHVTDTAAHRVLLSKHDENVAVQEWKLQVSSGDLLYFQCRDDSANVNVYRQSDSAVNQDRWAFFVVTYDGAGGASAMDTVTLYQDGAVLASTAANNASYVAMENGTSMVGLARTTASGGAVSSPYNGRMAGGPLGKFFSHKELSADEVRRLYEIGRRALGL